MAQAANISHREGLVVDGRPWHAGETLIPPPGRLWKARGGQERTEDLPPRSDATKLPSVGATASATSGELGECLPDLGTAGDDRDDSPLDYRRQGEGHNATRVSRTVGLLLGTAGPGKGF